MAIKYAPGAATARATALGWVGRKYPPGWCLRFQALEIFKVPGVGDWDRDRAADAEDYWKAAVARGKVVKTSDPAKIPAGVMIMWTDPGRNDYGHAAYSLGGGMMVSTDLPTSGKVGKVKISEASRRWGHKLVGYVLVDGNGFTLTPKPPKPPAPPADTVRWFEQRFLNVKGDDDAGARTFAKRAEPMVGDLIRPVNGGRPDVLAVCELRDPQVKVLKPLLLEAGFELAHAHAGNGLWVAEGTEIGYRGNYWLPAAAQGAGRREALLRVRAKVNGHWAHFGVGHLDYRPESELPGADLLRVKQARTIVKADQRFGARFELEPLHRHFLALDENSHTWTRDKAFGPAGFVPAVKYGVDAIYTGKARPVLASFKLETESDHPIVGAVIGKAKP